MKSSLCSPQLEKAHVQQWRPNAAKILKNKFKKLKIKKYCLKKSFIWICVFEIVISFLKAEYFILREVTAAGTCAYCLLTLSSSRRVIFN